MESKYYLQILINEYENKELSKDDLISTLKHYAELYHEELINNTKPMQQPINYCDIMALGFTAEDGNDEVCKRLLMLLTSVKASTKAQRWFWPTVKPHLYKMTKK